MSRGCRCGAGHRDQKIEVEADAATKSLYIEYLKEKLNDR